MPVFFRDTGGGQVRSEKKYCYFEQVKHTAKLVYFNSSDYLQLFPIKIFIEVAV